MNVQYCTSSYINIECHVQAETGLDYVGLCWIMLDYVGLCWIMLDY